MLTLVVASCLLQVGQAAILEFSGDFCLPCKQQAPITRRLEAEGVKVWHVDFEKRRDVAAAWKVDVMPTLIVVERTSPGHAKEVNRFVGVTSYATLKAATIKRVSPGTGVLYPTPAVKPSPGTGVLSWWFSAAPGMGDPFFNHAQLPELSSPFGQQQPQEQQPKQPSAIEQAGSVTELALACHVRVRVDFGRSRNWGSGVIIERFTDGKRCTVLTNKHVVESGGTISIDDGTNYWSGAKCEETWPGGSARPADDLAVVMVHRQAPINATICDIGYKPVCPLYVVGSAGGAVPRVREIHATGLSGNSRGGWNLDLSEQTYSGDSGGGVYDSKGFLVGLVWGNEEGAGGIAVDLTKSSVLSAHSRNSSRGFQNAR